MTIIGTNGSTLAAYDPKEDKLVVVAINSAKTDKMAKLDLSGFDKLTASTKVTAIRTSGSLADGENWADVSDTDSITVSVDDAAVYANLLANSITTYIIDGVHYSGKGSGEATDDKPAVDHDMSKLEEIELSDDMLSGSTPWNNDKNADVDKTIDGNLSTFFDGLEGGYLTVDLGKEYDIKALLLLLERATHQECLVELSMALLMVKSMYCSMRFHLQRHQRLISLQQYLQMSLKEQVASIDTSNTSQQMDSVQTLQKSSCIRQRPKRKSKHIHPLQVQKALYLQYKW
ncbi:MAG: hypothetical protein II833_02825, partial [Pseudobutyrivibrio sp.]|nr:hypothetical protein [Pseudobutyrivibrio sp.]